METRPRNVAFNIQMCDNGKHRRKDRPNGGMYVTEAEAATTITAMLPSTQTVAVCEVPETEIIKSNNPEHCIGLKYRVSASSYHPFSVDHSQALAAMCDQAVSYEIKPEEHPLSPKKTSAITQYGEECASTITAEFDGMPCPDRGPSAVAIGVFNMDEHTPEPETSLDNGKTSNLIPSSPEKPLIMESIGVSFDGRKDIPMSHECSQTETVGTNPGHQSGVAIGMKYLASEKSRSPISIEHAQALVSGCPNSAVAYETDKTFGVLPTNSANAHTRGAEEEVCPTLAKGSGESGNKPTVAIGCDRRNQNGSEEVQPAIQSSVSDRGATCAIAIKAEGFEETGSGYLQNGCQTLRAEGENRPSEPSNVAVTGPNAEPGTQGQVYPVEAANPICCKHKEGVMTPVESTPMPLTHIVRRLTVTECERLMGFPDNYTKIPYRNKPAADCPDSPRYKALGNSWATNCAEWVLRRIVKAIKDGRA